MKHYIFGVSGSARSGKDSFADGLKEIYGSLKIAAIDKAKRQMGELWDLSYDQLFGNSKDTGDSRYKKKEFSQNNLKKLDLDIAGIFGFTLPVDNRYFYAKAHDFPFKKKIDGQTLDYPSRRQKSGESVFLIEEGDQNFWISPREILQVYGMALQDLYEDIWIQDSLQSHLMISKNAKKVSDNLIEGEYDYEPNIGIIERRKIWQKNILTIYNGIRHPNEINFLRTRAKELGFIPVFIRVKRPGKEIQLSSHVTETNQRNIPDEAFDFVVSNDSSLEDFYRKAQSITERVFQNNFEPKLDMLL